MERYWQQHQLWDGTYTIDDLADIHEMICLRSDNERIAHDYIKAQNEVMGK